MLSPTRLAFRLFVLVTLIVAAASEAQANRVVNITVTVDGKKYLSGDFGDNGSEPKDKVWFYLDLVALHPEKGIDIEPDEVDPTQAILVGKRIEVDVQYAGKVEVTELMLNRNDEESTDWHIDSQQIRDMGKKLGFTEHVPADPVVPTNVTPAASDGWPWLPTVAGAILAVVVVLYIGSRGRNRGKQAT